MDNYLKNDIIKQEIGVGSKGIVYEDGEYARKLIKDTNAYNKENTCQLRIARILSSAVRSQYTLLLEPKTATRLQYDNNNIIQILCKGQTLFDTIIAKQIIPGIVLKTAISILNILVEMHPKIIHGDIHIGNIMLCNSSIKLIDFGECKFNNISPTDLINDMQSLSVALQIINEIDDIKNKKLNDDIIQKVNNTDAKNALEYILQITQKTILPTINPYKVFIMGGKRRSLHRGQSK